MGVLEERRRHRQAIDGAEETLTEIDRRMRRPGRDVPPMEATSAQLKANPQQAITLNVEWVAAAVQQGNSEGWRSCIDAFQLLIDYANSHPKGHRAAFDESVSDETLRAVLYQVLDAI